MSQVVVVSGGAGGIGGATVARFVAGGARVVFTDWDEARGAEQACSAPRASSQSVNTTRAPPATKRATVAPPMPPAPPLTTTT